VVLVCAPVVYTRQAVIGIQQASPCEAWFAMGLEFLSQVLKGAKVMPGSCEEITVVQHAYAQGAMPTSLSRWCRTRLPHSSP
jgi:hypothetical protein